MIIVKSYLLVDKFRMEHGNCKLLYGKCFVIFFIKMVNVDCKLLYMYIFFYIK